MVSQLARLDVKGRRICLVIPDGTRRCPLASLLAAIRRGLGGRPRSVRAVVALGTHAPMSGQRLKSMVGDVGFPVVNHAWWDDRTFVDLGVIGAGTVSALSEGRFHRSVPIRINRCVIDADVTIIVSPVVPHEVAGFSGGNKYLFPGLSGQAFIDVTHWLGALLTSREIIGTPDTPVRALIDVAAGLVPGERHAFCFVVDAGSDDLRSIAFGTPVDAWSSAVGVAAQSHIEYLDAPVRRVLALVPDRYPDLWTGAKGFYKVEPVVADGGEVVLFAPHITEVAVTHPGLLRLGYHCRDFYLAHWEKFEGHPWGELAHSTHLFGGGTYDPVHGERRRVQVTLATGIPEEVARRINLGYLDPKRVDIDRWGTDVGTLVVHDAGEMLYRIK